MSGSKQQAASSSSSKPPPPPKNPIPPHSSSDLPTPIPIPNPNPAAAGIMSMPPEVVLSGASHLSRQEVLKRRLQQLRQLSRCYRDHYWGLMEDLKIQYRDYYWKFGVSPFKHNDPAPGPAHGDNNIDQDPPAPADNNLIHNANAAAALDFRSNHRCLFVGCKFKAMALTSFCHLHILSDSKQKLYKACTYVIKSAQAGPITCGKPILRSTVPSLCTVHFQKAQKHVNRALKKAGLNVSSSTKLAPKFHVIVAEYVHQIQAKRRAAQLGNTSKPTTIKEETAT